MMYPPQPGQPFGGQPEQQPGFPPPTAYPRSDAGPQSGYPEFGPPQQPPSGNGQPGFGAPSPPEKGKKGRWIGLTVGLVMILAALGVTGFWAPGFLVTKNNVTKSNAAGATPQRALQTLVDALNQHDQVALTALECADADLKITNAIRKVAGVSNASIVSGPTRVSDTEYDGVVDITYNGESQPFTGKLALESDGWCWKDAGDPPTPS